MSVDVGGRESGFWFRKTELTKKGNAMYWIIDAWTVEYFQHCYSYFRFTVSAVILLYKADFVSVFGLWGNLLLDF